jgi:methylenetetrahydrofolate dehydrogenase (NAD+)
MLGIMAIACCQTARSTGRSSHRRLASPSLRSTSALSPQPPLHPAEFVASGTSSENNWQQASPANFVDVTPLAAKIRSEVRNYSQHHPLKLVGILANVGPFRQDSQLYSERIAEALQEDLIDYELWRCKADTPLMIQETIRKANEAEEVDGIIVFYPIFPAAQQGPYKNRLNGVYNKTHDSHFRDLVSRGKDVEGLRGTKWYHNSRRKSGSKDASQIVYPCTARSVEAILEQYHSWDSQSPAFPWLGQTVSIVNRSEIVGRPLAAMLARKGANVYSIDEDTIIKFWAGGERLQRCITSLEECVAESSIIVTGVRHEGFQIPTDCIASNSTLVNVSEFTNIDEESLLRRPDIRYIPQVGKVTVAILEENLVQLHRRKLNPADWVGEVS